ncbi:MAG: cell wall-binding repeat-containing protein [Actinomycetales bacterium]
MSSFRSKGSGRRRAALAAPFAVVSLVAAGAGTLPAAAAAGSDGSSRASAQAATDSDVAVPLTRVAGDDRWETAAQIAAATYPNGADTALLANGDRGSFADALSASYLAGALHAPILLTSHDTTPSATLNALRSLGVTRVVVIGGSAAISDAQYARLNADYSAQRLGGIDRYATNEKVLDRGGVGHPVEGRKTALIASGANFPDALAAGAVAAGAQVPLLLTSPGALSSTAAKELKDRGIEQAVIVGGASAVSDAVAAQVKAITGSEPVRLGGVDRGDTSSLVAEWAIAHTSFSASQMAVASGAQALGGADALTGAAHAGSLHIPVLITDTVTSGRAPVAFSGRHESDLTGGYVYGGPAAVALSLEGQIEAKDQLLPLQVLSFNDFHGNLESGGSIITGHHLDADGTVVNDSVPAGGAAYLAANLANARQGHANTVTVGAGDMIGASPLLSAAFHDEPTVEALNSLGLEATAVGNHEFDEGYQELLRMQQGGCLADGDGKDNQNSCADPAAPFKGARFQYLAANVKYASGDKKGQTILPPTWIKTFPNGARVGFIGMTLKETPSIVTQSGVAGLSFTDEVATANALVPSLRAQGVDSIVVLIHQGAVVGGETWKDDKGVAHEIPGSKAAYDAACGNGGTLASDSPILPIAAKLDPAIDLVISGHTHQPYVCTLQDPAGQPRLLTSASSYGRLYTDIELKYDQKTREIVRSSVDGANVVVDRSVTPDSRVQSIIDKYKQLVAPIAGKVIGYVTPTNNDGAGVPVVTRTAKPSGESPLGDLIADAQLADPSVVANHGTPVVAFMNPGGIRADLAAKDGKVTYEAAFTVQPFNNYLVSMTVTGKDIYDLLQQQWTGANAGSATKILQVSKGFTYSYTSGPTPSVVSGSVKIGSTVVKNDTSQTFRIVTNNFLSDGGDNFAAFTHGTDKYIGGLDIDAFSKFLTANSSTASPFAPTDGTGRIVLVTP